MKKLLVLLMVTAFACSPLIQSEAQAAPQPKVVSGKHLKKANIRLKHKVAKLHKKLQMKHHKHHKSA